MYFQEHQLAKRETSYASCSYVNATCKAPVACGTLPLYQSLEEPPVFGEGVAPWKADIYVEGKRVCSASLFGPDLLITHRQCAEALMPDEESSIPTLYSVARLGNYHDLSEFNFLAGHEQVSFGYLVSFCNFDSEYFDKIFDKIVFLFPGRKN